MEKSAKILIVGQGDIIENSLSEVLRKDGYANTISATQHKLDVLTQARVQEFFQTQGIDYVFLASVISGGIEANQRFGADFLYRNLVSQVNVIEAARLNGVKKLLFFGSSCVYPRQSPQPMKEKHLLTDELEKTSEPYSVAKIAGIKLCQAYRRQYGFPAIVAIPATIYGPGMEVDTKQAHVLGALIKKFHDAVSKKEAKVTLWGTGNPRREFIYVSDFVAASKFLMERYDGDHIMHIGSGQEVSIRELAKLIAMAAQYEGKTSFDRTKPDGAPRKLLDSRLLRKLGWRPQISLSNGIIQTYQWYRQLAKT
jgi:GDP-L-fucose synthase